MQGPAYSLVDDDLESLDENSSRGICLRLDDSNAEQGLKHHGVEQKANWNRASAATVRAVTLCVRV